MLSLAFRPILSCEERASLMNSDRLHPARKRLGSESDLRLQPAHEISPLDESMSLGRVSQGVPPRKSTGGLSVPQLGSEHRFGREGAP